MAVPVSGRITAWIDTARAGGSSAFWQMNERSSSRGGAGDAADREAGAKADAGAGAEADAEARAKAEAGAKTEAVQATAIAPATIRNRIRDIATINRSQIGKFRTRGPHPGLWR
ncbi:MAG: hypothetical protein JO286_03315 [Solirubrobacterales bacterium]|nr:hypothetical protein [Solirubrobacterales bacterium]MBV9806183.1 hypothetical protein [Solirubrobacterales bacterium]